MILLNDDVLMITKYMIYKRDHLILIRKRSVAPEAARGLGGNPRGRGPTSLLRQQENPEEGPKQVVEPAEQVLGEHPAWGGPPAVRSPRGDKAPPTSRPSLLGSGTIFLVLERWNPALRGNVNVQVNDSIRNQTIFAQCCFIYVDFG